jgi:hypothetical protein
MSLFAGEYECIVSAPTVAHCAKYENEYLKGWPELHIYAHIHCI